MRIKLREFRRKAKKSQMEIAIASGVSVSTISEIELGKREPELYTLWKLTRALGLGDRVDKLIEWETHDPLMAAVGAKPVKTNKKKSYSWEPPDTGAIRPSFNFKMDFEAGKQPSITITPKKKRKPK